MNMVDLLWNPINDLWTVKGHHKTLTRSRDIGVLATSRALGIRYSFCINSKEVFPVYINLQLLC